MGSPDCKERLEKRTRKERFVLAYPVCCLHIVSHLKVPHECHLLNYCLKRRPISKLDLLRPDLAGRVEKKKQSQKEQHDSRSKDREFNIGTTVWVRNRQRGDKWWPGNVKKDQ